MSEQPNILEDFVGETELAAELGKHPRTVRRWPVPFVQLGNKRLYHRPTVRTWLMRQMRNSRRGLGGIVKARRQ
jgi:hypothetical protein